MKNNLTLLTLALAGLLAAPALRAEDPKPAPPAGERPGRGPGGPGRGDPAERLKMLKEKLNLTDEQAEKIKAIFEENREKMKEFKDLQPEERRAKMQEFRKGEQEKIDAVLTPEQKEKAKEMREAMGKRREGGPGGPGGPGGGPGNGGDRPERKKPEAK